MPLKSGKQEQDGLLFKTLHFEWAPHGDGTQGLIGSSYPGKYVGGMRVVIVIGRGLWVAESVTIMYGRGAVGNGLEVVTNSVTTTNGRDVVGLGVLPMT